MSRKFLVDEDTLFRLVRAREELSALECGGVDNWHYCCDSLNDYLKTEGYEDFDELAKDIVNKDYEVFDSDSYFSLDDLKRTYDDLYKEVYNG